MKDYVLDAAVTLRRNYADLPFDADTNEETARRVSERAVVALERSGESYAYLTASGLPQEQREALEAKRLISPEGGEYVNAADYLRMDEAACVETAGEDHLLIAAYDENGDVKSCLATCRALAERLADTGRMAQSEQFGYLTAKPCDAGTGMRASMLLHLPMTAAARQIPAAAKLAGSAGMNLRIINGGICLLENRVTLGREEDTLTDALAGAAQKLTSLERGLRWRAKEKRDLNVADKACRAYATARYALRMTSREALQLWSSMVLGTALDGMPYEEKALEGLWRIAHTPQGKLTQDSDLQPEVERARQIRALFAGGN